MLDDILDLEGARSLEITLLIRRLKSTRFTKMVCFFSAWQQLRSKKNLAKDPDAFPTESPVSDGSCVFFALGFFCSTRFLIYWVVLTSAQAARDQSNFQNSRLEVFESKSKGRRFFVTGPDCSETSVFFVESLMISSSSWTLLLEGL